WHKENLQRKFVIKRIGHLATYIPGDVDFARAWYNAKGRPADCMMYPSNLFKRLSVPPRNGNTLNIQLGNSSDPTNGHFEMLKALEPYKDSDIRIYAPLSYPDPVHASRVKQAGLQMFGDKFVALTEFLSFPEYLEILGKIDIAMFNHNRQQAMGNKITLL